MSLFRPSRERRAPDRFVHHKMLIFVIGAASALAGMATGRQWLVTVGIVVLLAGLILRIISHRDHDAGA